ncbi:MAG: DUF4145 domain-containing protein [Parvularculaceae bacterium]
MSFRTDSYNSEEYEEDEYGRTATPMIHHWPPKRPQHARERPAWLRDLHSRQYALFDELYTVTDRGALIASSILMRTIFDAISGELGVNVDLPFSKKLEALLGDGYIGQTERDMLEVLVDAGSAAAHRGWCPEVSQLHTLMTILEGFAERVLLVNQKAKAIRPNIPSRQRKAADS